MSQDDRNTVPMDYPLPQSNWVPSGNFDSEGRTLYYTRPWTPQEYAEAKRAHRKQRSAQ